MVEREITLINLLPIKMSKFNTKNTTQTKTTNLAGGEAFIESPQLELVSLLLTSFVKDQFYRSSTEAITQLQTLIDANSDKRFVAKAAIYARTKFGMRSISHVVAAELATRVKGEIWTKNFFDKIIHRPDDMTEILAYYYALGRKNEPNALKKGFASAFARFDEYQLAKYKKEGSAVSLIDVANVVHPQHSVAIEKLIKGTLKAAETWENKLTKAGQDGETEEQKDQLKADVWKQLVKTKRIGYFALLRNLRNILEQAPEILDEALEMLVDTKLVQQSLVLPFRFTTAMEEIGKINTEGVRKVVVALNKALDISVANVPKFDGKTLVIVDESGSMEGQSSQIASLFAAILYKSNDADLMMFQEDARYVTLNPTDSTLTLSSQIDKLHRGGGTNFDAPLQEANRAYDRMIFLSDMQGWMAANAPTGTLAQYKTRTGANPKIYSFDLAGLGTLQFPQNNVYCLAGFSDKVFDIMKLLEQDRNALITEIEKIEL